MVYFAGTEVFYAKEIRGAYKDVLEYGRRNDPSSKYTFELLPSWSII